MDRVELEQWVQLKILKRFDVLVDCSDLSDTVLRKLVHKLPRPSDDNPTFAGWCDQVFSPGFRPLVAQQKAEVPGQTRLNSLSLGLATQLRRQDRTVKALQAKLDQALAEQQEPKTPSTPALPAAETEESRRWRCFYSSGREALRRLIGTVEGIQQAHIFDYQGATNKDYRIELLKSVNDTLKEVKQMGYGVVATFPTLQVEGAPVRANVFYEDPNEAQGHPVSSFSVDEMPTDILHLPHNALHCAWDEAPPEKAIFLVELYILDLSKSVNDAATQHLTYYLQKFFQALAKSADHVPRGVLREMLLLGLMLTMTAPHISLERTLYDLPLAFWQPTYDDSWQTREEKKTDLDPGQIVDLFIARMCSLSGW